MNFLRKTPNLAYTVTNKAPMHPVKLPIINAAGKSFIGEYN